MGARVPSRRRWPPGFSVQLMTSSRATAAREINGTGRRKRRLVRSQVQSLEPDDRRLGGRVRGLDRTERQRMRQQHDRSMFVGRPDGQRTRQAQRDAIVGTRIGKSRDVDAVDQAVVDLNHDWQRSGVEMFEGRLQGAAACERADLPAARTRGRRRARDLARRGMRAHRTRCPVGEAAVDLRHESRGFGGHEGLDLVAVVHPDHEAPQIRVDRRSRRNGAAASARSPRRTGCRRETATATRFLDPPAPAAVPATGAGTDAVRRRQR